jgi:prophage tail gpP-like protein
VIIDPTRRIAVYVAGQIFNKWMKVSIKRDLKEISGSFELEYIDEGRLAGTLSTLISPPPYFQAIKAGMKVRITIDDETVLVGFVGEISGTIDEEGNAITAKITGKDICGDLVDCAASPNGPAEWKNITLTQFATGICQPFGIGVLAQTDVGAPFPVLAISPHDKAMPAMEKAARQRGVLLVSDGVANLLLTTAGSTRAPDQVKLGYNIVKNEFKDSWEKRYSDVYVKGQTARANGNYQGVDAVLTPTTTPGTGTAPAASATSAESAGIIMTGHAQDPEITRWRPDVRMVNTQSGSSTVQEQAEWHVRVDRGLGHKNSYTVVDWRAGPSAALWRPNQVTAVYDPYAGIDEDMLIEGVDYLYDEQGSRTLLHLVGATAYDRINEPARKQPRHQQKALATSV